VTLINEEFMTCREKKAFVAMNKDKDSSRVVVEVTFKVKISMTSSINSLDKVDHLGAEPVVVSGALDLLLILGVDKGSSNSKAFNRNNKGKSRHLTSLVIQMLYN